MSQHPAKSRRGRPDQASAPNIEPRVLSAAAHIFINEGYTAATIDAIAAQARASKRTVYSRFPSKMALFEAVVSDHIEQSFASIAKLLQETVAKQTLDVRGRLLVIGKAFRAAATDPTSQALERIVSAEARTFPALVARFHHEGFTNAVKLVGRILADAGAKEPAIAANAFYHLLVVAPMRSGATLNEIDDRHVEKIIDFTLEGAGIHRRTK